MTNSHNFVLARRTPFGGSLLAIFILFGICQTTFAQVTTNSGSGLAATYTSLANAITALNALPAVTGSITITLNANETAPVGGYVITASGAPGVPSNTVIVIQGGISNPTITANAGLVVGTLSDAIFKLVGADFVILENLIMQENPANTITTAANNNMTEWGVAVLYGSTTNGTQNDTIRNNRISLNRDYANTFGVYANSTHAATTPTISASATTAVGSNSSLGIRSNIISNVNQGIAVIGALAPADYNNGVSIIANTITNFGNTGTMSAYANIFGISGSVFGVLVKNTINYSINNNRKHS